MKQSSPGKSFPAIFFMKRFKLLHTLKFNLPPLSNSLPREMA